MTDVEQLVRETLRQHERNVPQPDPLEVRPVAVRARRRQVLNAIGAGLVALVIVLGAVGGIGALLRADARRPAVRPPPAPPASPFVPVAFPPPGVGPSTPPTGEIVLSFSSEDVRSIAASEPEEVERVVVDVYEDGRVIWSRCIFEAWTPRPRQRPNADGCVPATIAGTPHLVSTGWVQQRLTARGVDLLRTELLSTGLFARNFESVTTNSTDLVEYLHAEVRQEDRVLNVDAVYQGLDINPPGPTVLAGLKHIQGILIDLDAWLPESAWAEREITAFVPSSYSFWFKRASVGALLRDAPSVEVVGLGPRELPPPADALLTREGCEVVTLAEARAVVDGFADVGITSSAEMSSMDIIAYLVIAIDPGAAVYFEPSSIQADLPESC